MMYKLLPFFIVLLLSFIGHTKEVTPVDPYTCKMSLLKNKKALKHFFKAIDKDNSHQLLALKDMHWDVKTNYQNIQTLLYYAAFLGKPNSIQTLVTELGAKIIRKDKNGWSVLHYLVFNKDMDISSRINTIYTLVELGANISALDKLRRKPSDYITAGYYRKPRISQEQKDKLARLVLNVNDRQEIARLLRIKYTTLYKWVYFYKKAHNLPIKSNAIYTQKEKEEAIRQMLKLGIRPAAKKLDIPIGILFHWSYDHRSEELLRALDPKKAEAIRLGLRIGTRAASEKLEMRYSRLKYWISQHKRAIRASNPLSYSAAEKNQAIRLGLRIGSKKASKKLAIPYTTLNRWVRKHKSKNKQQVKEGPSVYLPFYTSKEKTEAIKLASEIGTKEAAQVLDIAYNTLRNWERQHRKKQGLPFRKKTSYSLEEKAEAVILALRTSIEEAAEQLNISQNTLGHWLRQYKEENSLPVQTKSSYSIEERIQAIRLAYQVGIEKASETLDIKYHTIRFWVYRYEKTGEPQDMIQYIPNPSKVAFELERIEKLRQQTALRDIISKASFAEQVRRAIAKEVVEDGLSMETAIRDYDINKDDLIYWMHHYKAEAH